MGNTVNQEFYSAEITFYNCMESNEFSLENIQKIIDNLKSAIGECTINITDIDNGSETFTIIVSNGINPYYSIKCDYELGYPDVMYLPNGDPGYPGADGYIDCYESTRDLLLDIWGNPIEWDFEVIDEDFENEESLWEKLSPEEPDEKEY